MAGRKKRIETVEKLEALQGKLPPPPGPKVTADILKNLRKTMEDAALYEAKFNSASARHREILVETLRGLQERQDSICMTCGHVFHQVRGHACPGS